MDMVIEYENGERATAKNIMRPVAVIALEERDPEALKAPQNGDAPQFGLSQLMFLTWVTLGRPGDSYEAWLQTVVDFTPAGAGVNGNPPEAAARTRGSSRSKAQRA